MTWREIRGWYVSDEPAVTQPNEIPLKRKYLTEKPIGGRGRVDGNHRASVGKHLPHPDVPGYRRHGYRCEPKWNPKP